MLSTLYYVYTEKVRYELCLKRWKNGPISLAFSIYVEKKTAKNEYENPNNAIFVSLLDSQGKKSYRIQSRPLL